MVVLRLWPLPCALALLACAEPASGESSATTEATTGATSGAEATSDAETAGETGEPGPDLVGLELMTRLAGLWSGPATMTPLGTFDPMNMDLRAADGHVLFSRADLDASNALRFAFSIETIAGQDRLVYRNGGYFLGLARDSRTVVESHTPTDTGGIWRFCAIEGGCDYIDAVFELESETELVFDVKVNGAQHVYWLAERVEARELPDPFPVDTSSTGAGEVPFPPMPTLAATVSWQQPLDAPADVWILLSTQDCPLADFCDLSRSIRKTAEPGATSLELEIDQIHAGSYRANAILDRDQNLSETLFPGSGDAVSLPNQAIEVASAGTTTIDLLVLVEL